MQVFFARVCRVHAEIVQNDVMLESMRRRWSDMKFEVARARESVSRLAKHGSDIRRPVARAPVWRAFAGYHNLQLKPKVCCNIVRRVSRTRIRQDARRILARRTPRDGLFFGEESCWSSGAARMLTKIRQHLSNARHDWPTLRLPVSGDHASGHVATMDWALDRTGWAPNRDEFVTWYVGLSGAVGCERNTHAQRQLAPHPMATGQRCYCLVCCAKYRTKWSMLLDMDVRMRTNPFRPPTLSRRRTG